MIDKKEETSSTKQLVEDIEVIVIFKLPQQSNIKMADWSANNETHHSLFCPRQRLWILTGHRLSLGK